MPWNRSRLEKPSEKDLRRRSALDPSPPVVPFSAVDYGLQTQSKHPFDAPRPFRDSVVSLSAVNDASVTERAGSPPVPARTPKHRPFSMLKFRHASDSQLSKTAKEQAGSEAPPVPSFSTPAIITTAPTQDNLEEPRRKQAYTLPRRLKSPQVPISGRGFAFRPSRTSFSGEPTSSEDPKRPQISPVVKGGSGTSRATTAPPAYGDESNSALALPLSRLSDSSRSDGSLGDHGVFATTTTTHTVSTTTTFFRLPRRKKDRGPLFPLPPRVTTSDLSAASTPRLSTGGRPSELPIRLSFSTATETPDMPSLFNRPKGQSSPTHTALAATSLTFAAPGSNLLRNDSSASRRSARSSTTTGRPSGLQMRGRSSTMSSLRRAVEDDGLPTPPIPQSTRTSTSTSGRTSLGGIFNLSRLRQSSEPMFGRSGLNTSGTPETPGSTGSKQNSFSLSREPPVVIPERQEGDTPAKYLARLEEVVNRGAIAALLSKSDDEFSRNVLRSYMRRFKFFEDPLDMAVRKMLMHVELPKETQHIDRTLQSFADRYHECNPGIFLSPDEAYFIAFSILILHTDVFNKNNKHKMQKSDYTKNTRGQGVPQEILECFYDNIAYTPFIHVEDDVELTGDKILAAKSRNSGFKGPGKSSLKKSGTGPVDPYALILDGKLDTIRPSLDDILEMQDPFNYLCSGVSINLAELQRTFYKTGVIQIVSSRSRPEAFMTQATITNPLEAQVGVVDMKVTKVGILWRKDTKKKKARSPWQEWGAILTGSQLYFFRNTSWIKSLISQHDAHHKQGRSGTPVVFKPPLEQFKPDFLLSTEDVVALVDSNYKKHKHAFVFTRQNVFQEVLLADSDADMNDWLAKLNYAAAFRTAGVRMRGVVGGLSEGIRRSDSQTQNRVPSSHSINGPIGEIEIRKGRLDDELAQQVMVARQQIMGQKISEANEKLAAAEKQLDGQLRNARHLQLLAPIQLRTREDVVTAALRLAANVRWARMESWRIRCHRDILSMDLEEDVGLSSGGEAKPVEVTHNITLSPSSSKTQNRAGFNRLSSKSSTTAQNISRNSRPGTQPSGGRLFSMEDIFRSPTRLLSQHKAQGSWELPQLAFDRKTSLSASRHTTSSGNPGMASDLEPSEPSHGPILENAVAEKASAEKITPAEREDHAEHSLLVEVGLVSPESTTSDVNNTLELPSEDDKTKGQETDGNDNLTKVRHSLQRKLQSAHVPNHHRSRKGKDSSSSVAVTEDNSSAAESEGLSRGIGTFTVHGKKASVITFGSEWQNVPPEERLKLRKQVHVEESRLSVPMSAEDDGISVTSGRSPEIRPLSARSTSTATTRSLGDIMSSDSHLPERRASLTVA
ncbi:hypothetical protein MMC17_002062 [Xylographa soralifera]|nr:hypothetical protein [Xylographa soralifera]